VLGGGVWIGLLALGNARARRTEIGILRAIGFGSVAIARLFMGRALILGLLGAPLGFFLGGMVALEFGPEIFSLTAGAMRLNLVWLAWLVVLAPAFTAISTFIPMVSAVTWDPVRTLRDE
jgi:ABC-type lipoprotein release transport system permease subunit